MEARRGRSAQGADHDTHDSTRIRRRCQWFIIIQFAPLFFQVFYLKTIYTVI
jgi:hypothetical protein